MPDASGWSRRVRYLVRGSRTVPRTGSTAPGVWNPTGTRVDRMDFDRGVGIPAAWPALRGEARPIFERMGIWEADLNRFELTVGEPESA